MHQLVFPNWVIYIYSLVLQCWKRVHQLRLRAQARRPGTLVKSSARPAKSSTPAPKSAAKPVPIMQRVQFQQLDEEEEDDEEQLTPITSDIEEEYDNYPIQPSFRVYIN